MSKDIDFGYPLEPHWEAVVTHQSTLAFAQRGC